MLGFFFRQCILLIFPAGLHFSLMLCQHGFLDDSGRSGEEVKRGTKRRWEGRTLAKF